MLKRGVLNALFISVIAVMGISAWLLWPVWCEYQDQQRADVLFVRVCEMDSLDEPVADQWSEIQAALAKISSPTVLSEFYQKLIADFQNQLPPTFHALAICGVFDRLADINTNESVQTFVQLYLDDARITDGEYAEIIGEALFQCRERALPYLRGLKEPQRSKKKNVISWLEEQQH